MYVPPITGSEIWVWKAEIPTNWTVLGSMSQTEVFVADVRYLPGK